MEDLRRQLDDILSHHNESLILNWEVPSLEEKIEPAKPMALEVYQTQISKTEHQQEHWAIMLKERRMQAYQQVLGY